MSPGGLSSIPCQTCQKKKAEDVKQETLEPKPPKSTTPSWKKSLTSSTAETSSTSKSYSISSSTINNSFVNSNSSSSSTKEVIKEVTKEVIKVVDDTKAKKGSLMI